MDFGDSDHSIELDNACEDRLNSIFSQVFQKAEPIIQQYDNIIVQGDTATVAAITLVAYHLEKKIFHIEAGLRSFDLKNPYPEEGYRQIVSRLATVNFCPTQLSAANLKREKVLGKIYVVGNTVLDNIRAHKTKSVYSPQVLVTLHRRENLKTLPEWLVAIDKLAAENPAIDFIYPVHPNPLIREAVLNCQHITFRDPLSHKNLISILKDCLMAITDSGGIQEEGSFLNKKVIVCRKTTERPEGIQSGHSILCKSPSELGGVFEKILENYTINVPCPYGDGHSASKILQIINT